MDFQFFFQFRPVYVRPGSQAKLYHTKPIHFWPIFRPFWPIFWPKVPKSKWIWFEDTYPLNWWVVLSWKYRCHPMSNSKNIISVQYKDLALDLVTDWLNLCKSLLRHHWSNGLMGYLSHADPVISRPVLLSEPMKIQWRTKCIKFKIYPI